MSDQDLNFDFDSGSRSARKQPNSSRRRRADDDNLEASLTASTIIATNKSFSQSMRRNSRTNDEIGGDDGADAFAAKSSSSKKAINSWGEDNNELTKSKSITSGRRRSPRFGKNGGDLNESVDQESFKETTQINRREIEDAEELDIPEIPDMEETVEPSDTMNFQIAEAPDIQVHEISTYKELDKEFFKEKAFQFLEGNIDVSLLHCGLSTEQQIAEEEDTIWEWNKLFTEVVSVLSNNKRENEKDQTKLEIDKQKLLESDLFKESETGRNKTVETARRSQAGRIEREINFE